MHCLPCFSLQDKEKITANLLFQENPGETLAEDKVIKERSDETA